MMILRLNNCVIRSGAKINPSLSWAGYFLMVERISIIGRRSLSCIPGIPSIEGLGCGSVRPVISKPFRTSPLI